MARLNLTHNPHVEPGSLRWALAMASTESQECTVLKDDFYDVSYHLYAPSMQLRADSRHPGRFLQMHESCYRSSLNSATRTLHSYLNCSGNGQAAIARSNSLPRPTATPTPTRQQPRQQRVRPLTRRLTRHLTRHLTLTPRTLQVTRHAQCSPDASKSIRDMSSQVYQSVTRHQQARGL